mgnify:CR=1 FL=1|tara:strand:+ start:370 stop:498 length:129 start_codon:yes stop_codon:yes gene_type:complete
MIKKILNNNPNIPKIKKSFVAIYKAQYEKPKLSIIARLMNIR